MDISEESLCFHYQLGLCIASWSTVEMSLADVSKLAAGTNNRVVGQLLMGFHAIENFRSKLAYVDAIVQVRLSQNRHKKNWDALVVRTENAAKNRNKLAHNSVIQCPNGVVGRRVGVAGPKEFICVRDLVTKRMEFDALGYALVNYAAVVFGIGEKPFPESYEQPTTTPSLRAIRSQIREALSLPPLPPRR